MQRMAALYLINHRLRQWRSEKLMFLTLLNLALLILTLWSILTFSCRALSSKTTARRFFIKQKLGIGAVYELQNQTSYC